MKLIEKKAREFAEGNLLDNDEIWTFPEQVKVYQAGWRACREEMAKEHKFSSENHAFPFPYNYDALMYFGDQEVGE